MSHVYKRIVSKGHLDYCYLKIRLEFEEQIELRIDPVVLKLIITQACCSLFGEVSGCHPVDILKYDPNTREAILRVHHTFFNKLWASITLLGEYQDHSCAIRILQVSSHLMALAANSRTMELNVVDSCGNGAK